MIFKLFSLLSLLLLSGISRAQEFSVDLSVSGRNAFVSAMYFPENNINVYLDRSGQIVSAPGVAGRDDSGYKKFSPGDVDFYGRIDGEYLAGKVKRIGKMPVTYYDKFDWPEIRGKVKAIGNVEFKYYDRFNWDELKGKIKTIGNLTLTYHDRFSWSELTGKLQRIGNTSISYYDRFGPGDKIGRVKEVNGETANVSICWPQQQGGF